MEAIQMLGSLGEFVGAIAVVATLIYLTVQVRHSREAMEENSRLAQSAVLANTFVHFSQVRRHIIDNADVARIWREGCAGQELDENDLTRFNALGQELVYGTNSIFGQAIAAGNEHLMKSMPPGLAASVHANPGIRRIWGEVREGLASRERSSFVEAVDIAVDSLARQQKAQQALTEPAQPSPDS